MDARICTLKLRTLEFYIEIEDSIFTLKIRDTVIPKRTFLALNRDTRIIFRLATEKINLKISPLRGTHTKSPLRGENRHVCADTRMTFNFGCPNRLIVSFRVPTSFSGSKSVFNGDVGSKIDFFKRISAKIP